MKPTYNKIKNNFVRTPREITEALLKMENFEGKILEPCCGDGAISEVLKENGFEVKSSDLFDYGYGEIKDLFDIELEQENIITNPPFSLKVDMIEKLLSVTKKKLVLLWYVKNIGNLLEGRRHKNLKTIYIFKKRIEWKETKIGWLFAWYVWEKGYEGDVTIKRIDWEQPIAQSQNSATQVVNDGFNMGLEVQKSKISSPKLSPTEITSPNPNIMFNKSINLEVLK